MLQNHVSPNNKKTKKTPKTSANLKYPHISKTNNPKGKTSISGATIGSSTKETQPLTSKPNRHNSKHTPRSRTRLKKNPHNVQMQPQLQTTPHLPQLPNGKRTTRIRPPKIDRKKRLKHLRNNRKRKSVYSSLPEHKGHSIQLKKH